jgi:hypothetical protein
LLLIQDYPLGVKLVNLNIAVLKEAPHPNRFKRFGSKHKNQEGGSFFEHSFLKVSFDATRGHAKVSA